MWGVGWVYRYVAGVYVVRGAEVAAFLGILQDSGREKLDFPLVEVGNQATGQRAGAPKSMDFA